MIVNTLTRFVLENTYVRVVGGVFPPYIPALFDVNAITGVDSSQFSELKTMSDADLVEAIKSNALGIAMTFPVQLKKASDPDSAYWTLPLEPMMSVTGKNTIIKRNVSKGKVKGTIKERWNQDDYQLSIDGMLINFDSEKYPESDVRKLRTLCESAELSILCPLTEIFSISKIVIDDFDLPFTSGPQNQAYKLKASSDDIYKLLLTGDDLKTA